MNRKLLTAEGYQHLQDELNDLVRKERPEITKIVSWAASLGDRSENADYIYNKRKLREIDRRIRYLIKLFEVAHKVEYSPEQDGKAYFGAWVELENDEGETIKGEFKHEVRQFEKSYDNQQAEQISLMV